MLFKAKLKISADKLKLLFSLLLSLLIISVVFVLNGVVVRKGFVSAEKRYLDNCVQVLQGYSVGVQYYLENYHTSLSSIYDEKLFEEGDTKKIQDWITRSMKYLSQDFCSVFYVDSNFMGYFPQGNIIDLHGRAYISPEHFKDSDYYVSDMFYSDFTEDPVFFIEEPYFDRNHTLKGILCAAIKIKEISKISKNVKIGEQSTSYIFDRSGKLLDHVVPELIGKVFVPKSEKYKHLTSDITAREENGYVETENHLGEPIDLFYARIKNCGWSLSVGFPKKYLREISRKYNLIRFVVVVISIFAILILLFTETLVSDYFYKNQLIEPVYDPLTKLWTIQKFEAEARKIFRRNPKARYMLVESDIRGFKFINQNYGEEAADKMVYYYSTLINKITLEYKGIIGHGYADHFCSIIKVRDLRNAMNIFKGQMYFLSEQIRDYDIPFYPKFGVTFYKPSHCPDLTVKDLIGQASFAKSTIKSSMLLPYALYNATLLGKVNEEQILEHNMQSALEKQEFFVMYQPKILLENDSIVGAEALVRWKSPLMGTVYPDKFIPLFEKNGFVVKLDFYVYDKVFKFLDQQIKAGKPVVPVSVNMSRNHNQPKRFMAEFMRIFRKYSVPPRLVQVEIIERSVMDRETLCEITNALHSEGFTVAMDDFGSGESSLNMITKVPVDVLKFDRDFKSNKLFRFRNSKHVT